MKFSARILAVFSLLVVPNAALAEIVWTCTAPSVTDGKPTQMRYAIAGPNQIIDQFNWSWNIVRNTEDELIAVLPFPFDPAGKALAVDYGAWTLIIDPTTGSMVKTITYLYNLKYNLFIRGTCVKD